MLKQITLALTLTTLSAASLQAQGSFTNVKVRFATQQDAPSGAPVVRWGEQFYQQADQLFAKPACLRPVWPFGTALPNGVALEFPGDTTDNTTLGYQCAMVIQEGSCRYVSGIINAYPDTWGATHIVTSISPC